MQQIKLLTIKDWPLIEAKIASCKNYCIAQTKEDIGFDEYLNYTYLSFVETSLDKVYGFFDDSDLVSMMTVYDFKILPAYILKNFKHFRQDNMYNPLTNGLAPTLNQIIQIQESKHLYTFYMAKTANYKRLNQERLRKLMFDQGCPNLKRYVITVEEIVPAGRRSKHGFHFDGVYYKRLMKEDTAVIRFTLPQEFRKNIDQNLAEKMINK